MSYNDCQDYKAFQQAGLSDVYKTICNFNLFMVCEKPNANAFRNLPDGYSFRLCRRNELDVWKRIIVEESDIEYVTDFYSKVYAGNENEFFRRCIFVCNANDKPVASCFVWRSYGQINTVGWLRVLPEYEGKGLGRALLSKILRTAEYPIYLHTQPTSICAIKLYADFGFALITNPIIGYRENDLKNSMQYLQKIMPNSDYIKLRFIETDNKLHETALLSKQSEF